MTRRSTPYSDALREDLAQRITDLYRDASVVKRLTHSIKRRDSVHQPMTQKVVDSAVREAHSVIVTDGARLTRQVKQDVALVARHYASRSFAARALPDGSVVPMARDAGLQSTVGCKGTPDAFSFKERDAVRNPDRVDASLPTHGVEPYQGDADGARCVIADWANAASHSAGGDRAARQMDAAGALCQMARDASCRTDAMRCANALRQADLLHRDKTQRAMINALGYGLDRKATRRVRKAFLSAMR